MFFEVRCTESRGRSPATFFSWRRTRCARRWMVSLGLAIMSVPCLQKTGATLCGRPSLPRPLPAALHFSGPFRKVCNFPGPGLLLLLAFLAHDALVGIAHALALVGLGAAIFADLSGDLANLLLIDARDGDFGRLRHRNGDALRRLIDHVVA